MTAHSSPVSEPGIVVSASSEPDAPQPGSWACQTGFVSDLLMRCGRDDQDALALLFDLLSPIITSAVSMTVDQSRVSDCVRDVFVEVWRDAPGYQAGRVSAVEWIMNRVENVSRVVPVASDPSRRLADVG